MRLTRSLREALTPPPDLQVSEWAAKHFRLSSESSAQVGQFRAFQFQIEPLNCLSPNDPTRKIIVMGASQIMKTQILMTFLGFLIHMDPGPVLFVEPRDKDAEAVSKDRVAPMLRDVPALRGLVADSKSRDSHNTIERKSFRGGSLTMVSAQVPENAAMRSIRYLLMDEVDRYPKASKEGDFVSLAEKRLVTYFWNSKQVLVSSPTIDGSSRIQAEFEGSDQRYFHVPCPDCGHSQRLIWEQVKWVDSDPETSYYECANCQFSIQENQKWEMVEAGEWVKQNPTSDVAGFHISQLYSLIRPWADIVDEFLKAKDAPPKLQAFINTVLAEPWVQRGDAPDWEKVKARCEYYPLKDVHSACLFLTAGVDVQQDRLEVAIYGWNRDRERWLVDYIVIPGSTEQREVWDELSAVRSTPYMHPSGVSLFVARMAIDSGFRAPQVYSWVRKQASGTAIAVKGSEFGAGIIGQSTPVDTRMNGLSKKRGLAVWQVNVSHIKGEIYAALRLEADGEGRAKGYMHLPDMPDEFFKQLTAEEITKRFVRGFEKYEWVKTRDRNEVLDTAVYARAAHAHMGADSWPESRWKDLEAQLANVSVSPPSPSSSLVAASQPIAPPSTDRSFPPSGGQWMNRNRGGWFNR